MLSAEPHVLEQECLLLTNPHFQQYSAPGSSQTATTSLAPDFNELPPPTPEK